MEILSAGSRWNSGIFSRIWLLFQPFYNDVKNYCLIPWIFLFHTFNASFTSLATYRGYRLLACDGSDLAIAHNPEDKDTHRRHNSLELHQKGYNQLHLNAYESYNILAYAQEKGWKYLIRAKDIGSRGILTHLSIPDHGAFDCTLSLILTRKQTKEIKKQPQVYRCLTNKTPCDFLDPVKNPFYTLHFRVLRFPISENTMECILTNLEEDAFPMEEIKKLYGWRWGIERSFRELK